MTPLHIEILLHYNSRPCDMEHMDAPAVYDYCQDLLNLGILTFENLDGARNSYKLTEKGHAWLDGILATPLPVQKWAMP